MEIQIRSMQQKQLIAAALTIAFFVLAAVSPASAQTNYKVGDKIEVEYSKTWYKAQILEVQEGKYKIHYEGYGTSWDEWVTPARMRSIGGKSSAEDQDTEAQNNFAGQEEWRNQYQIGDKVEFSISGNSGDFQKCTVTENEPQSVMRVNCEKFKHWTAGVYIIYSEANLKASNINPTNGSNSKNMPKQTGGDSTSLKIGEYACTGSGGRMMIGLGFKVTSASRYTDLDGKRSGTFTISGGKITFRGGHLQGVTGRDLKNNWFTVASQAQCGPY